MICSTGSGRMATMARLLAAGSVSQTISEDIGHQKLAVQYIYRELREADEANLIDEEDMHIFELKPMVDPLNLVCCNACKKPVRASRYAAHAELCKSLSCTEEIVLELDGGSGHKKPPRKERKKLSTANANQATSVGERERLGTVDGHDTAALNFHMDEQMQLTSLFPMEAKGDTLCVDGPLIKDASGISPGNTDNMAGAMPPPTKRSKLIAAESLLISDHLETATGVTKSLCRPTKEAVTCGEYLNGSSAGSGKTRDHDCYFPAKDFPAPLATKIFYSQRNHRLRTAIRNLYKASTNEYCDEDLVNPKGLVRNSMSSQTSSSNNFCHEQLDYQQDKSSEVYPDKSGGCPAAMSFPKQFPLNNVLGPPVGMLRTNHLSNPYYFAGNSGNH